MKLREERFKPKRRKRTLLNFTSAFSCVMIAAMWVFGERFGLDVPTLCIYTGIGLLIISPALMNKSRDKKLQQEEKHNDELRDFIGKEDNSLFF